MVTLLRHKMGSCNGFSLSVISGGHLVAGFASADMAGVPISQIFGALNRPLLECWQPDVKIYINTFLPVQGNYVAGGHLYPGPADVPTHVQIAG